MQAIDSMSGPAGRRAFLHTAAAGIGALALSRSSHAASRIELPLPGGPDGRELTQAYAGKGSMILQRARPPLLETPMSVFDQGVLTPVDRFYVRWHWADIPTQIDPARFTMKVSGQVERALELSVFDLMKRFEHVELVAVNQCSGNSRGFFQPRVAGGQWGNGAMGNARWTGVRLKDVLDAAGIKAGAVQVQCEGAERALMPEAPNLKKSLAIDHARDGEVMIAWTMNGQPLPLLNGFPMRLVVPGWYATYWTKMLQHVRVLAEPDTNFWMHPAYEIPDNWPRADMVPGQPGVTMVPINRMVPRSFITNLAAGARVAAGRPELVRGIAFGGDTGVKAVQLSMDGGQNWMDAQLGPDHGRYSFRAWQAHVKLPRGAQTLLVRCTNSEGLQQPMAASWNPGGFMRNVVEAVAVTAV